VSATWRDVVIRLPRYILGGALIYLGLIKALHPVEFLKAVRQYDMIENHYVLNSIAAILPWFEIFCGILLLAGIAVRGSALVLLALLISFTGLVAKRGWLLHHERLIPFCAVQFDCGCGTGEVLICEKLLENVLLVFLATMVLLRARRSSRSQ
jgi:uncharacterized membrane protein YphA (DoxX/SURF4 family)